MDATLWKDCLVFMLLFYGLLGRCAKKSLRNTTEKDRDMRHFFHVFVVLMMEKVQNMFLRIQVKYLRYRMKKLKMTMAYQEPEFTPANDVHDITHDMPLAA